MKTVEFKIDTKTLAVLQKIADTAGVKLNTVIKVALAKYLLESELK